MKTFIRKTALITVFAFTTFASSFKAIAQDNKPVYHKSVNPSIGITVDNATGAGYSVKDAKGNIVLQGIVKNNKTFFIPTSNLTKGIYHFMIGSLVLQEFEIR